MVLTVACGHSPPPPSVGAVSDDADLQAEAEPLAATIAELRGAPWKAPVKIRVVDDAAWWTVEPDEEIGEARFSGFRALVQGGGCSLGRSTRARRRDHERLPERVPVSRGAPVHAGDARGGRDAPRPLRRESPDDVEQRHPPCAPIPRWRASVVAHPGH